MKLKLVIDDEVKDEVTVIVRGDLDGDGRANTSDLAPLEYHLLEDEERDYIFGFYVFAADFNRDGVANVQDEGIFSRYLLEDPSVPSLNSSDLIVNP